MTLKNNLTFILLLALSASQAVAQNLLHLMVWEGYTPTKHVKIFEDYIYKKYNRFVKLDITYASKPEDMYKALLEKKAHLATPAHNLLKDGHYNLIGKRLIMPLNLKLIPNYQDTIPTLKDSSHVVENTKVYGIPFVHGTYALIYNNDFIRKPKTWKVLWSPKYKNRYSISKNYYEANIYITALMMGIPHNDLANPTILDTPKFRTKLRKLLKGARRLWEGVDKAEDFKDIPIGVAWGFSLPDLRAIGQDWQVAMPREGSMVWIDNYVLSESLVDTPFLRQVAYEWLNFVLSKEFQSAVVVRQLGNAPVNASIKPLLSTEELKKSRLEENDYFEKHAILWPTITSKRDRSALKKMWDEVVAELK